MLLAGVLFLFCPEEASAKTTYHKINVTVSQGAAGIQEALDEAHENADAKHPYKIVLGKGNYQINTALHIYSYTYLDARKATLTHVTRSSGSDNLLKVGTPGMDPGSGYFYKNITINGGKWDRNGDGGTSIKVAHASNFTIKNAELCNTVDGHLIETAGVNGLNVQNCYFHDSTTQAIGSMSECIQLDILNSSHFSMYKHLDDESTYVTKNVKVTGCQFKNVSRAFGSHTNIYGYPFKNITFSGNTLSGLDSGALILCGMQNISVQNNSISCKGTGIEIYNVKYTRYGTFMPTGKSLSFKNPAVYATIEGNTIKSQKGYGIYLHGVSFPSKGKNPDNGSVLPAGNYCIKKAWIKRNKISCSGEMRCPILIQDCRNVSIKLNQILKADPEYYAIYIMDGSHKITVSKNQIKAACKAGVRVEK